MFRGSSPQKELVAGRPGKEEEGGLQPGGRAVGPRARLAGIDTSGGGT